MTRHPAVLQQLSPERWKTLEPLVDAALALTRSRRGRFLDHACRGDDALRAEVECMVLECERIDPALDRPAIDRFASLFEEGAQEGGATPSVLAGRFRLERELGRGGMATVYLAHDLKHARDVAVKMVHPELVAQIGSERFLAEIQVTATLHHPHILPLFDSGEADGRIYFVMPYVEGGTLRDRLTQEGPLRKADALRIASQVADGLASAHEQGVVHRDIKPENILLAADARHAYVSDFGIALAMSHAGAEPASGAWRRVGTPRYMSPEQLAGVAELDPRTDIYSLGCVLYEMLIGAPPPQPGLNGKASLGPRVAAWWRRTLHRLEGGAVERITSRALAQEADNRYQSASELALELELAANDQRIDRRRRRWVSVGVTAAIVAVVLTAAASPASRASIREWLRDDTDPELIVVLPFRGDESGLAVLTGDNAARLLYDALGRWKDLKLGDEMGAVEAGRRNGTALSTLVQATAVARSLGAGRFVWGEVSDQRGVTRISAQLYDVRQLKHPAAHVVYLSAGEDAASKIEETADSLVAKLVGTPAASSGIHGTRMFAALKRYAEGHAALHAWNTELAERDFRGALDLDPHFPQAWLGLAQSMAWSGLHRPTDWLEPAVRALADSNALAPRDRLLARGLFALGQRRMADACDVYRTLIARDGRDFAAHYGLGDCLSMDRVVVADRASPTGWRFRGSLRTAIQEYLRALELVPSYLEGSRGQTFARLTNRILFDDPGDYRRGFALTADTVWMIAYPEIANDTLAFYPRPRSTLATERKPATHAEAVARNRQLLRRLTTQWVNAFPNSATAREHFSGALESLGVLDTLDTARRSPGALGAIIAARRLSSATDGTSIRLAAAHVRILLKLQRFAAAHALADSTLARYVSPTPSEANSLAPLAALAGRARLTARLLASAAADSGSDLFSDSRGGGVLLPASVLTAGARFTAYAALGAPIESLRVAHDRAERAIRATVEVRNRDATRATIFLPPSLQAPPTLGLSLVTTLRAPGDRLLTNWQTLARGDTATVRQSIARDVSRLASGDFIPAPDVSLQYALLALAARDTSMAIAILDRVTAALPELGSRLTTEVLPAAGFPRVLLLRARLAGGRPPAQADLWTEARVLWSRADGELRAAADSVAGGHPTPRSNNGRAQRPPAVQP